MKTQTAFLILLIVAPLLPWQSAANVPENTVPLSDPTPGIWLNYTSANYLRGLAIEGNTLWAATLGGVVRWNTADGSYVAYTVADGLADNGVMAVAVDGAGHLWFGTYNGLSEFDGVNWTTYTTAEGLVDNRVRTIAVDKAGHKWFGTYDGVSEFDGVSWTTYTTDDGLGGNHVWDIAVDGNGDLWFATYTGGVSRFDGTNWTTYTTADGLVADSVSAVAIDGAGHKWFGTYLGVSEFDGVNWTTYTEADGLVDNSVLSIAVDGADHKWFGTHDGVSEFDGVQWTTYTTVDGLVCNAVNAVAIDGAGHEWFGTYLGISEFDGAEWTTYAITDGPAGNHCPAIALDSSGHKWFAMGEDGVSQFDGNHWTTYTVGSDPSEDVKAVAIDQAGHVWAGTDYGVGEFDGLTWTIYTTTHGLVNNHVTAVAIDLAGDKWFGTEFSGVSRFDGVHWTTYTTSDGLANDDIHAIALDRAGHKWFATDGGVSEFDGSAWTTYTTADGLPSLYVSAIAQDRIGHMWFGTDAGVCEFDGINWTTYTSADGLTNDYVHAIAVDRMNNKWFGTDGGGASMFDGTGWATYTTAHGLSSNYVLAIAAEENGHIWFGGDGVSEFIPNADLPSIPVSPDPPLVAAFYYPWYGNPAFDGAWIHWEGSGHVPPQDISSDYYPTRGAYSVRDPATLAQHMVWLKQSGVDLIIASWWGQGSYEDQSVAGLLAQAAQQGIKVAFHIENYFGRSAEQLVDDVEYLYEQYGDSPAFFRTRRSSRHSPDGKAKGLFLLWSPTEQYGGGPAVGAAYWRPAMDQIHALPDGGIVLAGITDASWIDIGHFDGEYNYVTFDIVPDDLNQSWVGWASGLPSGTWFAPSVIPGFSANRIGYDPGLNRSREGGATYDRQWKAALQAGVAPQMVFISTFNEWHEGTQIEPAAEGMDDGQGYTYLTYDLDPTQYLSATTGWSAITHQWPWYACAQSVASQLGAANDAIGLYQFDYGDGLTEATAVGRRPARKAVHNPYTPARYIYFWVIDEFLFAEQAALQVTVDYVDTAGGSFGLQYDSTDPSWPAGAYKDAGWVDLTGTGKWRTATFYLPDAYFSNRQNGYADFRIASQDIDCYIGRVIVSKVDMPCYSSFLPFISTR